MFQCHKNLFYILCDFLTPIIHIEKLNTLTDILEKIDQNEKTFFLIKKSDWEYSVDILLKHSEKINLFNLYYILKSYTYNTSHLINFFLIISTNIYQKEEDNKKVQICHYIDFEKIKKMSMLDFEFFFKEIYDNDFNYIKKDELYGFRVVFFKESFFWKNNKIYPIYPWEKSAIYKNIIQIYDKEFDLNSRLKKLELENENLKKELEKKK